MDEILKSIQRIIAEDERTSAPRPVSTSGRPEPAQSADDILELTDALNEDGSVRHLAPIGGVTRSLDTMSPTINADERIAALERGDALPPLRVERVEPIVSPGISVVSGGAQASGMPVSTVEPEAPAAAERPAPTPPAVASRSLEDLVSDLLRPMLETWLDENLPSVVERLVRAEVLRTKTTSAAEKPDPGAE